MLISLFLISLVTLELILRHDEKVSKKETRRIEQPQPASAEEVTSGLLALSRQLETQGRGLQPVPDRIEALESLPVRVEA